MFKFSFALLITEVDACIVKISVNPNFEVVEEKPFLPESPDEIKGFVVVMEALLCLYAP